MALSFFFKADGTAYTRGLEKMRSQTSSWSGGISKMVIGAFAAGAVVASIKKIITASSDLTETISKSRVVFGESSDAMESWADTMDSRLGQSKTAALDAAAGFASMFNVLGIGPKEAERMSKVLVELASDMASFHNTSVEQALAAINSGLRGEMEPLRKFNVLLNEATLKQEAFSKGLFDGKGVLDLSSRAQAAYSLILGQSAVANGDFERTSGDLANSLRIMKAEITNLSAEFGNNLVPAIRKVMGIYEAAKILFGKDELKIQIDKEETKRRKGGLQELVESGKASSSFNPEDTKLIEDITTSTADLDRVMRNHGLTINDLHMATVAYMRAQEEEGNIGAENASNAAQNAKDQLKLEKDLAKEQKERIKRLERLREIVAKDQFASLSDSQKKTKLEEEKTKLEKTVKFEETHKAPEGEEDAAEDAKLKAKVRLIEVTKELGKLEKKESDRYLKAREAINKEDEKNRKIKEDIQKRVNAPFQDIAPAETTVIASSLASIGGGGNVASFTSDPVLAATIESNKILEQIQKNTQRTPAAPTIPEL